MDAHASDDCLAPDSQVGDRATLNAGEKAVYPGHGPCDVGRVVKRVVNGQEMMFYQLTVLDETGGELFVPVERAGAMGIRPLMNRSEIPALLGHLTKNARIAENWKERASDNLKLFATGSPFDLAEIVASLTELGDRRSLTLGESGTLGRARRLLVSEISEVMGETKTTVEEQLDEALNSQPRPASPIKKSPR